jgi:hypothetical protein
MTRSYLLSFCLLSVAGTLMTIAVGCGSDPSAGSQTPGQPVAAGSPSSAVAEPDPEIEGVWYGESVYDVDAFNEKLSAASELEAEKLQNLVDVFATIVMAAEFRNDSVVELDMMITADDGTQMRDRSVGTWNILERSGTRLKIETSEYKNSGELPSKQVYLYQFIDKDHFQFVPESISPDLLGFSPRVVFQRVEQPLADPEVAEQTGSTAIR